MPGLGIGMSVGLGGGGGGAPIARSAKIDSSKTGVVYTVDTGLKAPITVSRDSGSASLTFAASGNKVTVSISSALAAGTSLSAIAKAVQADGTFVGIPITITGATPTPSPTPTPTPTPTPGSMTLTGAAPNSTQYATYGFQPVRSGGVAPFTYAVTAGTPPTGTSVAQNTGATTGPLNALGTFNWTITVTDSAGATASLPCSMTVGAATLFALSQLPADSILDFDPAVGTTLASGKVASWDAKTGTGNFATAATAEQPTPVADYFGTGLPAILFNGASGGNILRGTHAHVERRWSFLVLGRPNADQNAVATFKPVLASGRLSDNARSEVVMQRTVSDASQNQLYYTGIGNNTVAAVGGFAKGTNAVVWERAAGDRRMLVNGSGNNTPSNTPSGAVTTVEMLGGDDGNVANRANVYIGRYFRLDMDKLPGDGVQTAIGFAIEGLLARTYGTLASLRADHPYINRAPVATDYTGNNRNVQVWGNSIGNGTAAELPAQWGATANGFSVFNGGVGGTTSSQILQRMIDGLDSVGGTSSGRPVAEQRKRLTILGELFQNDSDIPTGSPTDTAAGTKFGNAYQMVSLVEAAQGGGAGNAHIILWGAWEGNGATTSFDPAPTRAFNEQLRALYPNYYIDMHRALANLAAPGSPYADANAWSKDLIPTALRATGGDIIHLNTTGYGEAAKVCLSRARWKGWAQ